MKYLKDIYEAERKFRGKNFKRPKSSKTTKTLFKMDIRNTIISLPGFKDLLKEVKIIEEQEYKEKYESVPEGYEFKNLRKISTFEINQRVCNRYYKRKFEDQQQRDLPLYGWIYAETKGWSKSWSKLKKEQMKSKTAVLNQILLDDKTARKVHKHHFTSTQLNIGEDLINLEVKRMHNSSNRLTSPIGNPKIELRTVNQDL